MKTKHLFLATALMASFAACTNEEIVSDVQQNVATGRPTVENVKLTFGENVDSRLVYNKGYKWESTDVIGALLMDTPNGLAFETPGWNKASWNEKYTLSSTIHTSYPFTYDAEDKTWGTPGKMLEGNYFFAFPWESYAGNRQVAHSLIAQEQTGVGAEVRAESYAKNQFFIGYDRIVAGTQAEEALNNVTMTPVLGAIQLQIVNTGTQDYHINKVVLKGDLHSVLTFDPMNAVYDENKTYNYSDGRGLTAYFNSANYLGFEDEDAYNADKFYDKDEALLAVVRPMASDYDGFSQLYIKGTEEERLLEANAGNTAYVLIMATPCEEIEKLELDIYTDEGVVAGVDLTKINKEINENKGVSAITSSKVKEIGPDVVNTIKVQIDDNSFNVPTSMEVYNNNDLLQFIQWNANEAGARTVYAVLKKDVTLNAEMIETLASHKSLKLFITSDDDAEAVVTLAEDLDDDVLDLKNLTIAAVDADDTEGELEEDGIAPAIKVLGELTLTKNSDKVGQVIVVKEATLTIFDKQVNKVNIVNEGTLTVGNTANITDGVIINKAEMTVAEDAYVKAIVTNYGTIDNDGSMNKGVENKEDATITLGEEANLKLNSNEGLVITEDGAKVTGTNSATGRIEYVDGADVLGVSGGIIYREVEGAVANEPVDANNQSKTNVNTWVLVDDATFAADAAIGNIEIDGNYDIEVATGKTLTISGDLLITGNTTTEGAIAVKTITVEEGAEWTNFGTVIVNKVNGITNDGAVDNRGSVTLPNGSSSTNPGEWEGDDVTLGDAPATTKQQVMDAAVAKWAEYWNYWLADGENKYFVGNPYDFAKFVQTMNYGQGNIWPVHYNALVEKFYGTSEAKKQQAKDQMFNEAVDQTSGVAYCYAYEPSEFKIAVEKVLKGTDNVNLNAAKAALIYGSTHKDSGKFKSYNFIKATAEVFEDMTDLRDYIAEKANEDTDFKTAAGSFEKAMGAWVVSTADIESAIAASKYENYFMFKNDDIVAVARLWAKTASLFTTNYEYSKTDASLNTVAKMKNWFEVLYSVDKSKWNDDKKDAWNEISQYRAFIQGLDSNNSYTTDQINAAASEN